MSEFAPGSPWKAMMLEALRLEPALALAFAISPNSPAVSSVGGLFRPPDKCSSTCREKAKNLAESGTCDVPPRERRNPIGYY
jgi:hypothetical protein